MSITTELREWARDNTAQGEVLTTYPVQHPVHGTLESLLAIADRIDAEHQKAKDEWKAEHGQMWLKVTGLCVHSSGRWTVEVDEAKLRWHDADKLHHYTPPTVEDVLSELVVDWDCAQDGEDKAYVLKEYAAKLRLAGEDE